MDDGQGSQTHKLDQAKLIAIAESSLDGILMMDAEGAIAFWNPAAEKMFGYTPDEVQGRNLHTLLAPERFHKAHYDAFPKFAETGRGGAVGKILELVGVKKDGSEFPVELSLSSFKFRDEWWAVGTIRDITERKERETELLTLYQALEQSPTPH